MSLAAGGCCRPGKQSLAPRSVQPWPGQQTAVGSAQPLSKPGVLSSSTGHDITCHGGQRLCPSVPQFSCLGSGEMNPELLCCRSGAGGSVPRLWLRAPCPVLSVLCPGPCGSGSTSDSCREPSCGVPADLVAWAELQGACSCCLQRPGSSSHPGGTGHCQLQQARLGLVLPEAPSSPTQRPPALPGALHTLGPGSPIACRGDMGQHSPLCLLSWHPAPSCFHPGLQLLFIRLKVSSRPQRVSQTQASPPSLPTKLFT